jgi:hypothetical protein
MILDAVHKYLNQKHLRQSCWRTLVEKRPEIGEKEGDFVAHPSARGVQVNSFRPFSPNPFGAGNAGGDAAAPKLSGQARHPYLPQYRRNIRGVGVKAFRRLYELI